MNYSPRTSPRPHQAAALEKMVGRRVFALRMAQRTGKTWVALTRWGTGAAAGYLDDLLVVAPAGSYRVWDLGAGGPSELERHLDPRLPVVSAAWVSSSRAAKNECELLLDTQDDRRRVLVVNVEALSSVSDARDLCERFLRQRRCMMAVDESTSIRNPASKRTKRVLELGRYAAMRVTMTGLASPKSPLDLWSQYCFLDWKILGHREFRTFKARHAVVERFCPLPTAALTERLSRATGGAGWEVTGVGRIFAEDLSRQGVLEELERRRVWVQQVPLIKGYLHEDEIREKIAPWSYRVTLDEVRGASPPTYRRRVVRLTDEQKKAYKELKDEATTYLEGLGHVTATVVVAKMTALHRLLCGYARIDDTGKVEVIPELRTEALLEELSEYEGKAIVWVAYHHDVGRVVSILQKEYGEGCCARFWGGNASTREAEEARFRTDPTVRFMVSTAAAGGRGREWSCADLEIFYSNTFDLEHRLQAEERTESYVKDHSSDRVDLVAPGTVDERILEVLMEKADLAGKIEGEGWRRWIV